MLAKLAPRWVLIKINNSKLDQKGQALFRESTVASDKVEDYSTLNADNLQAIFSCFLCTSLHREQEKAVLEVYTIRVFSPLSL